MLQLVAERDMLTRTAALGMLASAYTMEGPPLWRALGRLTDPQRSLLEERFKSAERAAAAQGLDIGYRRSERLGSSQDGEEAAAPAQCVPTCKLCPEQGACHLWSQAPQVDTLCLVHCCGANAAVI